MRIASLLPLGLALHAGCVLATGPACEDLLVRVDAEGAAQAGSKERLIEFLNRGRRVRIGWQVGPADRQLTHWADPIFVTIFQGNVHAQLPPIHAQQGRGSTQAVELIGDEAQHWVGLIATTGTLTGRMGRAGAISGVRLGQSWCAAS